MRKILLLLVIFGVLLLIPALQTAAQTSRKSVSAAEVNGTFQMAFKGKYKGANNEIRILALGGGKLKVAFDLIFPFIDGTGEMSANAGQAEGEAFIGGDTAVFVNPDDTECVIKIKFVRPGIIRVTQEGSITCGFGLNVSATGTYRKISSKKPKFDAKL